MVLLAIFAHGLHAQDEKKTSAAWLQDATQHQEAGEFEAWRQDLESALSAARATGDKKAEAAAYDAWGYYFREAAQPNAARENLQKALTLWRDLGERKNEAKTLLGIGMVWEDEGRASEARENYLASVKISRALDDLKGEAEALKQVGSAYLLEGQPMKAAAYIKQALAFYQDEKLSDKENEAFALNLLGVSFRQRELYDEALKSFQDALKLQQELRNRNYIAELTQKIGTVYLLRGDPNNASGHADAASRMWRSEGDCGHEMGALIDRAIALTYNTQNDMALTYLRQALEIMEGPRESYSYLRANEIYSFRKNGYALMIKLLLEQNQPEEAFLWAQRAKCAQLREVLINSGKEPTQGATKAELQQEKALRERVVVTRRHLMVSQRKKIKMTSGEALEKEALAAENELSLFSTALYQKHLRLWQLRVAEGLRLSEVGEFLPDNTALLEFAEAGLPWEDNLVLFCVTARVGRPAIVAYTIQDRRRGEVRAPLKSLVEDFRLACLNPQRETGFSLWSGLSGWELHELLLGKATPHFAKKRRLLIASARPLWGLPFGALPNEKGEPLAQNYEIVYTSCASVAEASVGENATPSALSTPIQPTPKRDVALLGASTAQTALLKALFPNAASSNALNITSDAKILHINAPLKMDITEPLQSTLRGPTQNARLAMADLFSLQSPARLAVIAPSQITLPPDHSDHVHGDAWSLILHAFLNSGISAQVMTFNAVPDTRATPFFKAFYSELKKGRSVSMAQRNAVRTLLANPQTAHPAYWASFFVFGNWEQKM